MIWAMENHFHDSRHDFLGDLSGFGRFATRASRTYRRSLKLVKKRLHLLTPGQSAAPARVLAFAAHTRGGAGIAHEYTGSLRRGVEDEISLRYPRISWSMSPRPTAKSCTPCAW